MTGKIHYIPTDPAEEIIIVESDKIPNRKNMMLFIDGHPEYVKCLYEGHFPTTMIVHGEGRLIDLPVNDRATKIYWAASEARGVDMMDPTSRKADSDAFWRSRGVDPANVIDGDPQPDLPPYIHGPAILLEGIEVE